MEPDDVDQRKLVELWHLSRTALARSLPTRSTRLDWVVEAFLKENPEAGRKWVYVWCERYLGRMVDPDGWPDGPTNASAVPKRTRKKRAK